MTLTNTRDTPMYNKLNQVLFNRFVPDLVNDICDELVEQYYFHPYISVRSRLALQYYYPSEVQYNEA